MTTVFHCQSIFDYSHRVACVHIFLAVLANNGLVMVVANSSALETVRVPRVRVYDHIE